MSDINDYSLSCNCKQHLFQTLQYSDRKNAWQYIKKNTDKMKP